VSLAQLVGGVDVQTQHLSSNPHGHEFRFLFILEDQAFLELMQFILRTRVLVYSRLKIILLMLNGWCRDWESENFPPFYKEVSLAQLVRGVDVQIQ
jgi:hypothetical protein